MKHTVFNACDLLDAMHARDLLAGKKLGLVTNVSGVTKDLGRTATVLSQKYHLCALFSPEHGLSAVAQAGGFDDAVFVDKELNIPVYDLFGSENARKTAENVLYDLDAVVFDIQDIGVRYYTYQYTMLDAMLLCKKADIPFVVLDRVNPLGGVRIEGNVLSENCVSEVGRVAGQPVVSGMTAGELALWYNDSLSIGADVSVLRCEGWNRDLLFEDTDLLFVPPSPNMPGLDTVFLYSGTCLFEGTNLSEGRGTTKPFELFGAPWLDPKKVIDSMNALPVEAKAAFEGLVFRLCAFEPMFSDYEGRLCNGLQLHIRDKNSVNMFATGLYLLSVIRELYPKECVFTPFLTRLAGTKEILQDDFCVSSYLSEQQTKLHEFSEKREQYLLYECNI